LWRNSGLETSTNISTKATVMNYDHPQNSKNLVNIKSQTGDRAGWSVWLSCLLTLTMMPLRANADSAPNAPNFTRTTAGALSSTVPDGTCAVAATVNGGSGGGSAAAGGTGGTGGAGAMIKAQFHMLPSQPVIGAVGGGGTPAGTGGIGTASGGKGGTIVSAHAGAGGGGSSSISIAGIKLIEAGGGGGGGAAHNASPAGNAGNAGAIGIAPGVVAVGSDGSDGVDSPGIPGGGQGGQATQGGNGGVNIGGVLVTGSPGGGIGSGTGGNGGADPNFDSAGGGGGGYTGGGGGASTIASTVSGAGGGGGSSYLYSTSPTALASIPTNVSGTVGTRTTGSATGAIGSVTLDWIPCIYQLDITKTASSPIVNAGGKVIWTITVSNVGPDSMTRGDTVTLIDTLPVGPSGAPINNFKVLSISTTSSSDPVLDSALINCTGVTVGSPMPATTVCSRPYGATGSPGVTASGTRGLNFGETLSITYEQVFGTPTTRVAVTNTASVQDRASIFGTTDIMGVTTIRSASDTVSVDPAPLPSDPNVLLVKRITAINGSTSTLNGDNLAIYKDEVSNPYDDNSITIPNQPTPTDPRKDTDNWPNISTFMIGGTNGGNVKPDDELEYTIYFLSAGDVESKNVLLCDRVPSNTTFLPTAFNSNSFTADPTGLPGSDRGILLNLNSSNLSLTNIGDSDGGQFFPAGTEPTTVYPQINCGGPNTNGAVVVKLGDLPNASAPGIPSNSYGFVRFRAKVK
jgi:uncharacterized repeat protein (TIGR01451 family)